VGQRRAQRLQKSLADQRGRRVVFLSHCLLNQNVRYPGGAASPAAARELVDGYLERGIAIHQMPCPERHAWGGAAKRRMLVAFGAGRTWRAPLVRALLPAFVLHTRRVYARLARAVVRDVVDYRRAGIEVVEVVGVSCSPSCGVHTTLDLPGAVGALTRCPLAELERQALNESVIAAHARPGRGMFIEAVEKRLDRAGVAVPFGEHDLQGEL
jgi:predicted secreted protein